MIMKAYSEVSLKGNKYKIKSACLFRNSIVRTCHMSGLPMQAQGKYNYNLQPICQLATSCKYTLTYSSANLAT